MPELPEVETIKRQLEKKITGLVISDIEVRLPKMFQGDKREVIGKEIKGVSRRGKMLIIKLQDPKSNIQNYLVVHLKLTGQIVLGKKEKEGEEGKEGKDDVYFPQGIPFAGKTLPAKTTHVIFKLSNGDKLFFNDNRQFGWIKVLENSNLKIQTSKLGIEPFTEEFTLENFTNVVKSWKRAIKIFLMEQGKIAGVGNIYANEALFVAGILPERKANTLSEGEIEKLYNSLIVVLEEGIKYKGSSGKDESYISAFGSPGKYQEHFKVYQRDGKECIKCSGAIKRIALGGRGTFFCERCQK